MIEINLMWFVIGVFIGGGVMYLLTHRPRKDRIDRYFEASSRVYAVDITKTDRLFLLNLSDEQTVKLAAYIRRNEPLTYDNLTPRTKGKPFSRGEWEIASKELVDRRLAYPVGAGRIAPTLPGKAFFRAIERDARTNHARITA